jgi:hypothetical protein
MNTIELIYNGKKGNCTVNDHELCDCVVDILRNDMITYAVINGQRIK